MNKPLIICDRLMYGALLGMIFVLPYSLALIAICQGTMTVSWVIKRFLLCKTSVRRSFTQDFNFASPGMWWALIAIGLLIFLTIPFSHYPALSTRKFFTRFLQQIFLMYLVTQIVHSRRRLYSVMAVLLLTLFFVTVDAAIQFTWGKSIIHHAALLFGRVSGPMNHPNDLGTLLVTVLPVVFVLAICPSWLRIGKPWVGVSAIALLSLFLTITLGLTASRGAWIAFAVSMIALGIFLKNIKLIIFTILMLVIFFWIFGVHCLGTRIDLYGAPVKQVLVMHPSFTNPLGMPPGYNVLKLLFDPSGRPVYWDTAARVIKYYPWFGCGYSAYVQTLRDLHVGHEEYPHNSLLHITAELGLLGLILYGWFFTAFCLQIKNVLRIVSRERDLFLLGCGISSGIMAWMIHSLMDTAWASLQLSVLCWLFIGILLSLGLLSKTGEGQILRKG